MRDRLDATAERYGANARGVIEKTAKIFDDSSVNVVVKALLNDSPILTDLLYVIGGDGEKYAEFIEDARRNPAKAIRELVLLEDLTKQELKGAKAEMPEKGPDGKFVAKTPEPKTHRGGPTASERKSAAEWSQPTDELERRSCPRITIFERSKQSRIVRRLGGAKGRQTWRIISLTLTGSR